MNAKFLHEMLSTIEVNRFKASIFVSEKITS